MLQLLLQVLTVTLQSLALQCPLLQFSFERIVRLQQRLQLSLFRVLPVRLPLDRLVPSSLPDLPQVKFLGLLRLLAELLYQLLHALLMLDLQHEVVLPCLLFGLLQLADLGSLLLDFAAQLLHVVL